MKHVDEYRPQLQQLGRGLKVVYTDLDNTLLGPDASLFLGPDRQYTLEPARALVALMRAGIEVTPVSGRNNAQLHELARLTGLRSYIAELGCLIYYEQGREVFANHDFPVPKGKNLHQAVDDSGAPAFLLDSFDGRLEYHTPWSERQKCTHLFRGFINVEEANELLAQGGFSGLRLVDNGHCRSSDTLAPLPETHAYHLLPTKAGKASAIRADQKHRGLSPEETVAFGDSLADLEMAEVVDSFFLVRNNISTDPALARALENHSNVYTTTGSMGVGWAEAVSLLLAE